MLQPKLPRGRARTRRGALRVAAAVVLALSLPLLARCAPSARSANCQNDAECGETDRGHAYCLNSRCVECVTNSACGAHYRCSAGRCVEREG